METAVTILTGIGVALLARRMGQERLGAADLIIGLIGALVTLGLRTLLTSAGAAPGTGMLVLICAGLTIGLTSLRGGEGDVLAGWRW